MEPADVLTFWFEEIEEKSWWLKSEKFDNSLRERFYDLHQKAVCCELFGWRVNAEGRLAEIIVLDQFSRNLYRDQAAAFAADSLALCLAQEAVALGADEPLNSQQRAFLYMPYMHSESLVIHEQALMLFNALGQEDQIEFELRHKDIIARYGRYPHRNKALGRESTPEELKFLAEPGSSF